ncbi:hypothetical protein U0070_017783, partial [Myodes glareolus]
EMSVAILGPTLYGLAANMNRNISGLSLIFVGRASGFLCGTMIGGVLFDHMNQFFLLDGSLTDGHHVCLWGFRWRCGYRRERPYLGSLGVKGAPHMQALHFSFALGAFLAPLLAKLAWGTTVSTQNLTESDFDPLMLNRTSEATSDSLFAVPESMNLL